MNHKTIGIYIHIPFCVQKCLYCDFVSGTASWDTKVNYINQLLKEIELFEGDYQVDTVFIGGGTPSVLDVDWIADILCKLKAKFDFTDECECSIEVNPGTVDFDKLKNYREAGLNRLSIGLQSCNENELKALGRIHDYNTFQETYRLAREAGFDNINVDLMSSVPEQTEESFSRSLRMVCGLEPEHISVYSLIVEEGTPFADMELNLPDEETERAIYHNTKCILEEYGYKQYEISNYAKPGKECKHNIRYWKCEEYIGFGVAAASYLNGVRWKNTEHINKYTECISGISDTKSIGDSDFYCEKEVLSPEDKCAEFMFMGLRMNEGVSEKEFEQRFGQNINDKYGVIIEKHIRNELLIREEYHIKLTEKGRDICNYVMADFLL